MHEREKKCYDLSHLRTRGKNGRRRKEEIKVSGGEVKEIVRGGEMGTDQSGPRQQVYFQRAVQTPVQYFPSSLPGKERERGREKTFGETGERSKELRLYAHRAKESFFSVLSFYFLPFPLFKSQCIPCDGTK